MRSNRVSLKQNPHWAVRKIIRWNIYREEPICDVHRNISLCIFLQVTVATEIHGYFIGKLQTRKHWHCEDTCDSLQNNYFFLELLALHSNTKIEKKTHPNDFLQRYNQNTSACDSGNLVNRDEEEMSRITASFQLLLLRYKGNNVHFYQY